MRPGEEWFIIPVPAIIDKKLFERARAQLDANFALSQRNRKNEYSLRARLDASAGEADPVKVCCEASTSTIVVPIERSAFLCQQRAKNGE